MKMQEKAEVARTTRCKQIRRLRLELGMRRIDARLGEGGRGHGGVAVCLRI